MYDQNINWKDQGIIVQCEWGGRGLGIFQVALEFGIDVPSSAEKMLKFLLCLFANASNKFLSLLFAITS